MTVTSARVADRFTPDFARNEVNPPVYTIAIPTLLTRARFRRAVAAEGGRMWTRQAMVDAARREIEAAQPANIAELLTVCDRYEALDDATAPDDASAIAGDWLNLSAVLQNSAGEFAAKVADNQFWFEVAPLQAARSFLIEAGDMALRRGSDGLISEESIAAIPESHLVAIGWRAMALMQPSGLDAKNSESPRPSPSAPANSTSASEPQTEAPGISAVTSTSETQS